MFLGLDTSNYSTSAAYTDGSTHHAVTRLLPVKPGEAGLRQSDAVFHHTKQLPQMIRELTQKSGAAAPEAIGVSVRPRSAEGSYMPCFLCGEGLADSLGCILGVPVYKTSHQTGHVLAALYSAGCLDMLGSPFIAFHVSGGTTECIYCTPSDDDIISVVKAADSLDLKAGQLIDRTGLLLGLDFPCGIELEKLALKCTEEIKLRVSAKDENVSLSGFENKVQGLAAQGHPPEYVAAFVLTAVSRSVAHMTASVRKKYGDLPIIYSGGVMSDMIIRQQLLSEFDDIYFCAPELSRDNAVGTAIYALLKEGRKGTV